MADQNKAEPSAEKTRAVEQARRDGQRAAEARVARTEAMVALENTTEAVVKTSVYARYQEWPKWLYHRATQEKRIFDSQAEFEARVAEADKANWTGDPFPSLTDGLLRSPATGGASDPALRAAAQPTAADDGPPPHRPVQRADLRERVELDSPRLRDPQRVEAAADANSRARSR